MRFFIDTANLDEIKAAMEMGLVDGVTTNPTLMSKEAADWREIAREICRLVPGPVSLEVIALDAPRAWSAKPRTWCSTGPTWWSRCP
jgi:transaldolase